MIQKGPYKGMKAIDCFREHPEVAYEIFSSNDHSAVDSWDEEVVRALCTPVTEVEKHLCKKTVSDCNEADLLITLNNLYLCDMIVSKYKDGILSLTFKWNYLPEETVEVSNSMSIRNTVAVRLYNLQNRYLTWKSDK